MKNIFKLLVLIQIVLFISCKNAVTKTAIPTVSQKTINTDTVAHQEPHEIKWDTIKHQSNRFEVNRFFLYWEKNYVMADGGISEIYVSLRNYETKRLLVEVPLDFEDHIDNSDDFYNKLKEQSFEDYNFDGFDDVSVYFRGSMAMTSATAIYLFNPKTKAFEDSEELSATDIEVDKKNRILIARNFDLHSETTKKHHFNKFGKIKYTEVFTHYNDSIEYKTYEKIVNGKVVESKADSTATE
jgi:hypothetical protein